MDLIDQILADKQLADQQINEFKLAASEEEDLVWDLKGRNSKVPKKANHGARPCSSVMRKLKKQGWYKKITAF